MQTKSFTKKSITISASLLKTITSAVSSINSDLSPLKTHNDLNLNTAFKLVFAGFLCTEKLTYKQVDLQNSEVFNHTKLLHKDVTFLNDNSHVTVFLHTSKADTNHTEVEILISASNFSTYLVKALHFLFTLDSQPLTAPLFN